MTSPIFVSRTERRGTTRRLALWLVGSIVFCVVAVLWHPKQSAADPARQVSEPLPELPAVPSLEVPRPTAADLEELDARLAKLCAVDDAEREAARREILEISAKAVPALRFRLASVAENSKHDELKELLLKIRKKARDGARDEQETEGKRGKIKTPDYLQMAVEHAEPRSKPWCNLVSVLAVSRMLAQIGTVEAVRGLIDVYVRYGEFLRVDTQLELENLADRAVPALIEAQRHQAEKIAKWAVRELDALGKGIPSEAVQVNDLQTLSDVLRAYGRVRDPDAARIVVSFSNSERAQVREASRQAIALLGEVGAWQLRDTYETVVGKKPPRDWNWERTARELFGEFDRLRSAEVSKLFEAGSQARAGGDLEGMRHAFDQVLTRSPDYPKRAELASAYLEYAQKALAKDANAAKSALLALRKAERLGKGSPVEKSATSLRLTLEAEALAATGIADRTLLVRALEADPKNERGQRELARFERGAAKPDDSSRYYAAGAIGVVALAGILVVLFRRPGAESGAAPAPVKASSALDESSPPAESTALAQPDAADVPGQDSSPKSSASGDEPKPSPPTPTLAEERAPASDDANSAATKDKQP